MQDPSKINEIDGAGHNGPNTSANQKRGDAPSAVRLRISIPHAQGVSHLEATTTPNHTKSANGQHGLPSSTPMKELHKAFETIWGSLVSLPFDLQWVSANLTPSRLKPVIRSAVAGWVSILLIIIPSVERAMGQAGFLIMIAAFLSPPSDPFAAVLERELIILTFLTVAFGWSCLGITLASLARTNHVPTASTNDIYSGRYIQPAPTIICALFLAVGTSSLLYIKARKGPGPFLFAVFLACTSLDISLTVAPLFPYPYYTIVYSTVIPVAIHSAVTIACSILIFPETVNTQFGKCLHAVFVPLAKAIKQQPTLLAQSRSDPNFDVQSFTKLIATSEAALVPLAASVRLINRDLSWGRFGSEDLLKLHQFAQTLTVRTNGMAFYFKIMDPFRDNFFATPAPSRVGSPVQSPSPSQLPSPNPAADVDANLNSPPPTPTGSPKPRRPQHRRYHSFPHPLQQRLLRETMNRAQESTVGVFESQKYLNLETRFRHPDNDALSDRAMNLLGEGAADLLVHSAHALGCVVSWLEEWDKERFWKWCGREHEEAIRNNEDARFCLRNSLRQFRETERHLVLVLYRSAFDSKEPSTKEPPHRYLYQCYVYQYHLMQIALQLCAMLDEVDRLEMTRLRKRLWTPVLPLKRLLLVDRWEPSGDLEQDEDEDPDTIPGLGISPCAQDQLGAAKRRNPDALPPGSRFETAGKLAHQFFVGLGQGNAVFALKSGILTMLLSLPSFLPNTARFAYVNRFEWAIFMAQLSLSRFRGDTAYELVSRLLSTFLGGLVGLVMWYVSTGDGKGNPYGLAVVSAVCFPFLFFIRVYAPGPPMAKIIFLFTSQLVVGVSWQDARLPTLSSPGKGFEVAWRRFTLVSAGVTAAFLFSFLPPSTTLRRYIRTIHATTVAEIGQLYCDIVSDASAGGLGRAETGDVANNLVATRMKLQRSKALQKNVFYEFSLEGQWPKARYDKVIQIQVEIAYLLSHLKSVTDHLESAWARGFLQRTRFLESDFQGVVLAVISMISTALRTGSPLPQITPCPLLDRFMLQYHGLNVLHENSEDDYGLPRTLTMETLENEQYLCFSVGIATAFGIVTRLDRLLLSAKELVGEQYHIHGVGMSLPRSVAVGSRRRTLSSV